MALATNSYDRGTRVALLWAGRGSEVENNFASGGDGRLGCEEETMEIADWRSRIDGLDEQIVRLLNERAAAAVEIGKIKQKGGAPIYEPNREQTVFEHVRQVNPGPLTSVQLQDIYYRIMDVMRALQRVETADSGTGAQAGAEQRNVAP